jgi:hypothetical protein
MSLRHNENQKMALRLKDEAIKRQKIIDQANMERAQMAAAAQSSRKFSLLFVGQDLKTFLKINSKSQLSSFQVMLCKKLSVEEIGKRMEKAFGDI